MIAQLEFPDQDLEVISAATREREKSGGEASRLKETSQMYRITGQPVTTSHGQGAVHEESDKKMDANDERMEHTQQQRASSGTSRRTFLTAAALAPVAATVAGHSV